MNSEEHVAEAVFNRSFIPKSRDQVEDYERDQERIKSGKDTEGIYDQTITGLKEDLSGVQLSSDHARPTEVAKDLATDGVFSDDNNDEDDDGEEVNEDSLCYCVKHVKDDGDGDDLATSGVQNGVEGASKDISRPAEDLTPYAKWSPEWE